MVRAHDCVAAASTFWCFLFPAVAASVPADGVWHVAAVQRDTSFGYGFDVRLQIKSYAIDQAMTVWIDEDELDDPPMLSPECLRALQAWRAQNSMPPRAVHDDGHAISCAGVRVDAIQRRRPDGGGEAAQKQARVSRRSPSHHCAQAR